MIIVHIMVYVGKRTSEQDGDLTRQAISYFQPSALLFVTGSLLLILYRDAEKDGPAKTFLKVSFICCCVIDVL